VTRARLSLDEASRALRAREISPVDLARAHLERAHRFNPRLNALLTIAEERALAEAHQAEVEIARGHVRGPLHGIPYTAKDIFETAGVRTTAASPLLADWVPTEDAGVVAKLKEAGAVLLGKTHLSEFAAGPLNENDHYGPARNPWDTDRVTGGSSGGSAACVAAGIGFFSLGTDTGGSVRMPAALCGVTGFKPGFGVVGRAGVIALAHSLDTVGVLARTASDAAQITRLIAGHDARDPDSEATTIDWPDEARLAAPIRGLRVGVPREVMAEPCDGAVRAAFKAALCALAGMGAVVEEISVPWLTPALPVSNLVTAHEARRAHARWYPREAARYGRHLREMLLLGGSVRQDEYEGAMAVRRAMAERSIELFARVDIVALPATSVPAPDIGAKTLAVDGHDVSTYVAIRRYSRWASLAGLPAISVPCGRAADGRPIGLQLIGPRRADARVLSAAHAFEGSRPWTLPIDP
jgi:aspartyl-tRNA(Asn)/glutamyl-tRNA(Gln) amidotransferase subunit A